MSIGPGAESVGIELYTASTVVNRWQRAIWDGDHWANPQWQAIGCEVLAGEFRTGAGTEAGVLSVADAGALDVHTYDPGRLLDPLAAGSPYFGAIKPGTPLRLVGLVPSSMPAWTGYLDEGRYELASAEGRLRALDGIAYLAQTELPEATVLPNTLRARVRAVVAAAGLTQLVPVVAESTDPDAAPDPAVSAHDGKARAAWAVIQDAALDALTYVWLGPDGVLRFTAWGGLPDAKYAVGCPPAGEVGGVWLAGLAELEAVSQGESIRNSVRSYSSGTTFGPALTDPNSIRAFGERRLDVARIVPDAANWAQHILDDRSDAGLEVTLGEVRPYTAAELALLLEGAADGPSALRVADDSHGEPVDLTVAVIGAAVGVTANGWRFALTTMIPRAEWDTTEPPPPIEPPIPPPDPYHTETRVYVGSSDALIALTSGGAKYGAGAATTLPVGAWSGWTYRSLIQFPNIPGTKLRRLVSATLNLDTTDAVRVGFGSSPTIELKRITGSWSAGSATTPSSGNAVVWPGPACTGSIRANVTAAQNAAAAIRVDALVLPWLPSAAGGSLAAQRGLALYPGSGSTADTTEFWPVEKGGTQRPELVLVLEVFD